MNGKHHLKRLTRSGWGILGGVIAIGAAAAAAGAAPSTLTPWSNSEPGTTTTAAPIVTVAHDQVTDGHPSTVATTPVTTPPTEPATTQPATTQPETTQPATTQPASAEPATTQPASAEPARTEPATTQPASTAPPTTHHESPPTTASVPPLAPTEPAPLTPEPGPAAPVSDNVVPAGLSLACTTAPADSGTNVSCEWSGPIPAAFAKFVLLRGNGGATGRVPFQSTDASAHQFVDIALAPGNYSYVLVALDGSSKPLVHSNMVPITISG